MEAIRKQISRIASSPCVPVIIQGESGTGKESVAQLIHRQSSRSKMPFVAFNCSGVMPNLMESRFLGHEKGSFTGATESRKGCFQLADGGTLFLDEICDLDLNAQRLLLRVLEEGRFMPIGGMKEIDVDVRVVVATNRDIHRLVRNYVENNQGDYVKKLCRMFRDDLYQRLATVVLKLPPLREHKEDIPELVEFYQGLRKYSMGVNAKQLSALMQYDFPGNVRELFLLLDRAEILGITDFEQLIEEQQAMMSPPIEELPDNCDEMLARHVRRIFDKYDGNLTYASKMLGLSKNTTKKYLARSESDRH